MFNAVGPEFGFRHEELKRTKGKGKYNDPVIMDSLETPGKELSGMIPHIE